MAENKVRFEDLFDEDIPGKIAELTAELSKMESGLKEIAKTSGKKIAGIDPKSTDEIKQLKKEYEELRIVLKSFEEVNRQKEKAERESLKTQRETIKTQKEQVKFSRFQENEARRTEKSQRFLSSAYKQQSKELNDLIERYRQLALTNRENGVVGRGLLQNIREQDARLKSLDAQVGRNQRNVGAYAKDIFNVAKFSGIWQKETRLLVTAQKIFNAVLKANPLFIIVGVIVAVAGALAALRDKVKFVSDAFEFLSDALKFLRNLFFQLTDAIGLTQDALESINTKAIDKHKDKIEKLSDAYGFQIRLAQALGKSTTELEITQLRALQKENALIAGRLIALSKIRQLTDEEKEDLAERRKNIVKFEQDIAVIRAEALKKQEDDAKEARDKRKKEDEQRAKDAKAAQDKLDKQASEALSKLREANEERDKKDAERFRDGLKEIDQRGKSELELKIEAIEQERDEILKSTLFTEQQRADIIASFEDKIRQIRQDAREKELEEQKKAREKQEKEEEKAREESRKAKEKELQEDLKRVEIINNSVFEGLRKRNELQQRVLDDQLTDIDRSIQQQQELAARGLDNTLAFEEKRRAEALARKAELDKQAQKQEEAAQIASLFLEFTKSFAKEGDINAPAKALAQTLIARGISRAIAGAFAEGVEDLNGRGTETSDSNLALLSKGESVITAKGTRANPGLATAMNQGNVDEYFKSVYLPQFQSHVLQDKSKKEQVDDAMLSMLNSRLMSLEKTIRNKKELTFEIDNLGNFVRTEVHRGQKRIIINKHPFDRP